MAPPKYTDEEKDQLKVFRYCLRAMQNRYKRTRDESALQSAQFLEDCINYIKTSRLKRTV